MFPHLLAVALLFGQTSGEKSAAQPAPAAEKAKSAARPPAEIAAEVQMLLKKESAAKSFDQREALTKELAELYGEVKSSIRAGAASLLSRDEYRLRLRLISIAKDLSRKLVKAQTEADRQTARLARNPSGYSTSAFEEPKLQGGGTIGAANNLIQIIISTIDPDGWQINGGTHVIEYWPNGMALVVAAPIDVHEAIGGSLSGMRR